MGFTINEIIKTELHYKDVALIVVATSLYQKQYENTADKDILLRMKQLVNRLCAEMYDHPDNDNGPS